MTIDSHCHLDQEDYLIPVDELIKLAQKEGVKKILAVACDPKNWSELLTLLEQNQVLYGALGIHPEYAHMDNEAALNQMRHLFVHKKLVAMGEIGLDYHESPDSKKKQQDLFETQIQLAHELNKPVMIHTREAEEDTYALLKEACDTGFLDRSGVVHCFTGTKNFAKKVLDLGFYISASGVITFKSAKELREVFSFVPLDRLLVETDAPWLAPEPFRGQKNQPAFVQQTLKKLAEIKGISQEEMEKITDNNFYNLYLKESQ